MRTPDHWYRPDTWKSRALAPLSRLYGLGARLRQRMTVPARTSAPIVCIGNITAGGTGKTPIAIAIAAMLRAQGEKPMFLTRGYGGRAPGPMIVDARNSMARDVGDEPLLLARHAPTIVAKDRVKGADAAANHGAGVIVMDDGYQNPTVHKDVGLLVVDAGAGLGNGRLLPAGPLREPAADALRRADALIVMGSGDAAEPVAALAREMGVPVFRARIAPSGDAGFIKGKRLMAFAGIGRPAKFFDTLVELGGDVRRVRAFDDHHMYTEGDARALLDAARAGAFSLITTEKDAVRLAGARHPALQSLREHMTVLPVEAVFDDAPALDRLLSARLREAVRTGAYRAF